MLNKNFCLGISKPLNIFDKNIRKLVNYTLDNGLYIHTSITYPINFFFIKYLLNKDKRHKIKFICKILGDNLINFENTINLTMENYSIKNIQILQLVNLPINNPEKRDFLSIRFDDFNKIILKIKEMKEEKKIGKVYLQIFSKDDLPFCEKIIDYFDGFAFYSNIKKIFLKQEVYNFIKKKNIPCIILSIFGNPDKKEKKNPNLHLDSYEFSQLYFTANTIAVGRTLKIERLKEIIHGKRKNYNKKILFDPIFENSNEIQDTPSNYYNRYKVTSNIYIFYFLLKCLLRIILGGKIWFYLKKKFKNYEN